MPRRMAARHRLWYSLVVYSVLGKYALVGIMVVLVFVLRLIWVDWHRLESFKALGVHLDLAHLLKLLVAQERLLVLVSFLFETGDDVDAATLTILVLLLVAEGLTIVVVIFQVGLVLFESVDLSGHITTLHVVLVHFSLLF